MSGPKMSAADIKRFRLFEQDRRRFCQDLVRLNDLQKRRLQSIAALQDLCIGVMEEDEIKFRMQKLDTLSSEIKASTQRIAAVLAERNNEDMKEVLQNVSVKFEGVESFFEETEILVRKTRDTYFERVVAGAKNAAGIAGHSMDANPGPEFKSTEELRKEQIAAFEELAKEEAARVLRVLGDLKTRAAITGMKEAESMRLYDEVSALCAEGRDAFSLYEEVHRLDVMKVRPIRDAIEKEEKRLDNLDARLSMELAKYHTLCSEYDVLPKKFSFAEESIEAIRYECAALMAKHSETGDLRILMKNIRKSLVGLGYSYLGEREEDRDFAREIYRIHDDVILHVIYDSTGRVTMEVAVEDTTDRAPHPREVDKLVKEQVLFCEEYEKIFHAINQRGLEFRKENLYPVSPDFAQVINTTEFTKAGGTGSVAGAPSVAAGDDFYEYYASRESKYLMTGQN